MGKDEERGDGQEENGVISKQLISTTYQILYVSQN